MPEDFLPSDNPDFFYYDETGNDILQKVKLLFYNLLFNTRTINRFLLALISITSHK